MVRKSSERNYPQVEFRLGFIEDLPIDDETVDLVISNCMINLSPDKEKVYQEIFRVLKPGGRLSISALVRLSDLPKEMMDDEGAYCGCLTGAASVSELKDILASTGFFSGLNPAGVFNGKFSKQFNKTRFGYRP
ncbi:MAG: methyltransferase domain-containing protein [Chloroflexota bacterium]|jgi:SAM-dependent methyltransferase|nr:methyltransferase domain-containing protein [Chloroflexota bacterium]